MGSGIAAVGLLLLVVGVLGLVAGLGLIAFTQDDQATNADGSVDAGGAEDVQRQGHAGQTVAVGAAAVAFLGMVFVVIGRGD